MRAGSPAQPWRGTLGHDSRHLQCSGQADCDIRKGMLVVRHCCNLSASSAIWLCGHSVEFVEGVEGHAAMLHQSWLPFSSTLWQLAVRRHIACTRVDL